MEPTPVSDFGTMIMEISEDKFYALPRRTQDLLRLFGKRVNPNNIMTFEVPNYRVEEILSDRDNS